MNQPCPLSVRPGQIIGYVGGRPILAIAGASPDGDGAAAATGEGGAATTTTTAPPAAQTGTAATTTTTAAAPEFKWDGKVESLPTDVQKLIADARADAGKARVTAKEQAAAEAREELLKKLGLTKDGEEAPDPEKLAAQLASRDAQLAELQRERVAEKAARKLGGDIDALLDSRSFATKLGHIAPEAKDFDTQVEALVKAALEENPKLKQAQAAGVSGGQFTGGTGEGKARPTSLGAAIKASLTQ